MVHRWFTTICSTVLMPPSDICGCQAHVWSHTYLQVNTHTRTKFKRWLGLKGSRCSSWWMELSYWRLRHQQGSWSEEKFTDRDLKWSQKPNQCINRSCGRSASPVYRIRILKETWRLSYVLFTAPAKGKVTFRPICSHLKVWADLPSLGPYCLLCLSITFLTCSSLNGFLQMPFIEIST